MKILKLNAARESALALLLLSAAATVGLTALSQAQPPKTPASPAAAAPAAGKERAVGAVRIANTGGEYTTDLANGVHYLKRNVQLWQEGEDFILYADDVTYYEKDNIGTGRSNLHVESTDSTIIGDLLRADFTGKTMTLTGNVVLKSHGQKDGLKGRGEGKTVRGEVLHKPSSITCDRLDYDYETKQATLTGNIRMRQAENFGTCERILFDEDKNIVRLMGSVKFVNGDNQTTNAPDVTIWIDKNMIRANAPDIRIPDRKGGNAARPPRQGADFGPEPRLPDDLVNPPPAPAPLPADPSPAREASPAAPAPAAPATPVAAGTKSEPTVEAAPKAPQKKAG